MSRRHAAHPFAPGAIQHSARRGRRASTLRSVLEALLLLAVLALAAVASGYLYGAGGAP